ncbi:DedA family protein [Streptomyces sp. Go-475]|uniref:DedA family protein n=1 Tax=Streptomyces sp. Go-475 TaxID=2072505 RepID=UPI000DEEF9BC|nr:DedA family protein [Streptomyces sp. Go-475]
MAAPTASRLAVNLSAQSLLSTAGLLATGTAPGGLRLSLTPLLLVAAAGTLVGSQCGYLIGRRAGGALLDRSESARLHQGARSAEELPERYGHAKALVPARFVPVVRTVPNPMAGALRVPIRTFTVWQPAGGLVRSLGLILAGYALGSSVPNVDRYLLPIVALVALSPVPLAAELYRSRRAQAKEARG